MAKAKAKKAPAKKAPAKKVVPINIRALVIEQVDRLYMQVDNLEMQRDEILEKIEALETALDNLD